jgi:hypothetical protein
MHYRHVEPQTETSQTRVLSIRGLMIGCSRGHDLSFAVLLLIAAVRIASIQRQPAVLALYLIPPILAWA